MAHFALCSRPGITITAPKTLDTTMSSHQIKRVKSDNPLAWQQQEDFGTNAVSESNHNTLPVSLPAPHRFQGLLLHQSWKHPGGSSPIPPPLS